MTFDAGATLADRMRAHARDSTHLYGHLMRSMADDWERGGPVRDICAGWEQAPAGAVIQLRLLAGLFRVVLTGRADELLPYYPCLGGTADPAHAWPRVRPVLSEHVAELHDALEIAPQTNEVGRSTALLVGIFDAVRASGLRQIRLLEPGASAGLNLLLDRFRFESADWGHGPQGSPLVIRDGVVGDVRAEEFRIVERRGCDLSPVDPRTADGALRLRSFVWPFHVERHERLTAALAIASTAPATVDRAGGGEWLEEQLASTPAADVLTVVWNSITRQYWPAEAVAQVEAAIDDAARRMPVAWVSMEYPPGRAEQAELSVRLGDGPARVLGTVADHGVPVRLG